MSETQIDLIFPQVVGADFKPHWIEDLDDEAYHADRSSVSSTGIRSRSMAHFFDRFIMGNGKPPTKAMKFGTLAHKCIRNPAAIREGHLELPAWGDLRLKENKAYRDGWLGDHGLKWLSGGDIVCLDGSPSPIPIVSAEEAKRIEGMIKALIAHPKARDLLTDGVFEISGYFRERETGLKCRFRPDFVSRSLKTLIDYKTAENASPSDFPRVAFNMGYHIQMGMYEEGVYEVEGWRPEQCVLIAQESESPFAISVFVCDEAFLSAGQELFRAGCREIRKAIDSGRWPAYADEIQTLSLPHFVLQRILDNVPATF